MLSKKFKCTIGAVLLPVVVFAIYVWVININSKDMTGRQKLLKAVYPFVMSFSSVFKGNDKIRINPGLEPVVSFYDLKAESIEGIPVSFDQYKGKKVLLVNTASDCGFTAQYEDLQKLHERFTDKLVIIGFPANDFKDQEKGSNDEIRKFCKINFGVSFLLIKKSSVIKSVGQHVVFKWLSNRKQNGWNDQAPTWNFCKYLVDEQGNLAAWFDTTVPPMSSEVLEAIEK